MYGGARHIPWKHKYLKRTARNGLFYGKNTGVIGDISGLDGVCFGC